MERVDEAGQGRVGDSFQTGKAILMRRQRIEAVIPQRVDPALQYLVQPVVVKGDVSEILTDAAEGVQVAMIRLVPIDELDP